MWKALKEVIRGKPGGTKALENIDFEILNNTTGCNLVDKFNLYYIQSIKDIIQSIKGNNSTTISRRIIYVIENKGEMDNFEMVTGEQLGEIIRELPKKGYGRRNK